MQISLAVLSLLLLTACCSQVQCGFLPTSCCFKFTKNRLSLKQVKSYYITSSFCPHPAVVFTTRKGFKICARSSEKWVTDLIIQLPAN
ncbi:C-C motif chemokine 4 [Xenopus laevis]|uniref:C-C motif chemokine n=1 Tax=Xenopus laevis TaxID=8355 RepID=A0A8J0UKV0_XENLA|nr:C-C motif chemokine 4 [Xenopus laevis]